MRPQIVQIALIIFSLFTFHFSLLSQPTLELDSAEVVILNLKLDTLDYLREQSRLDSMELGQADSIISVSNKLIDNLQSQVFTLLEMQYKPKEEEPFLKWSGFWIGINTSYMFDSSAISKTVVSNLNWELTATARITINGKWELSGGAAIPFREKFKLKAGINYLIF